MLRKYSNGLVLADLTYRMSFADNASLPAEEKTLVICAAATAASKTLTLGLEAEETSIVVNEGDNAFTLKNVSGDSGTSIAAGAAYLVIASQTANASVLIPLYIPSV